MKNLAGLILILACVVSSSVLIAQEPVWNAANIRPCDRACDGMIHEVEVFPFVTLPYGLGDGWTPGSGR